MVQYKVMLTILPRCPKYGDLLPHWIVPGDFEVSGNMGEGDAINYANFLNRICKDPFWFKFRNYWIKQVVVDTPCVGDNVPPDPSCIDPTD